MADSIFTRIINRELPSEIIYEDEDMAAIVKPPGLTVHPSPGVNETTLVHGLLWRIRQLSGMGGWDRPGIVHRLDRDTSGVMVVAKNDSAHHKLSLMFKAREVHKTYVAVCTVREAFRSGVIEAPIGRNPRDRKAMSIRYDTGRAAITEYQVRHVFGRFAVVEAHPRSGRTHQIRVHLKFMGMPLLCDALYGYEKVVYPSTLLGLARPADERPLMHRQALHARRLCLTHPRTGMQMCFESALPPDMLGLIGFLLGVLVRWTRDSHDVARVAMAASLLSFVLIFTRGESASIVRGIVWYSAVPFLAVRVLSRALPSSSRR